MGKESNIYNQLSNKKMTQKNENSLKNNNNQNKKNFTESLFTEKPQYNPNNLTISENTNFSKKDKSYLNNKFKEKKNKYMDPYSYAENKAPRKNSGSTDGTSSSDEGSTEKRKIKIKKTFQKKNRIPFKCDAKDFKIKYKTELCKYFEINGYCKYGDKCAYAHGKENLRSKVTNTTAYRTKKCAQFFEQGYCPYGNRCQFAHQLKSNIINNPYDRGMTYGKILETISKLENVENIKKLIEKPRLPIFKEICENNQNKESRLLEDIKSLTYDNLYKRIDN